jgi:hypothetical protein
MAAVLASSCIGKRLARHRGQPNCVVEFAGREQSCIGRDQTNCSIRRRSKSSLRARSFDSPAGFANAASLDPDKVLMPVSEWRERYANQCVIRGMRVKVSSDYLRRRGEPIPRRMADRTPNFLAS